MSEKGGKAKGGKEVIADEGPQWCPLTSWVGEEWGKAQAWRKQPWRKGHLPLVSVSVTHGLCPGLRFVGPQWIAERASVWHLINVIICMTADESDCSTF